MIKMIAAVSKNGVIGQDNKLPFDYPEDMKFFRKMTANSTVVMGRKTFESIGRPLPKRHNVVVTRTKLNIEGVVCAPNLLDVVSFISLVDVVVPEQKENIWFIGGSSIYREGMRYAQEIYLTLTPDVIEGEGLVFFPWIDPSLFEVSEYIDLADSPKGLKVAKYIRKS